MELQGPAEQLQRSHIHAIQVSEGRKSGQKNYLNNG